MNYKIKYPFLDLATVNARYIDQLHQAASRVIDSGRYIGGTEVEEFEHELAQFCKAPHAIGVANGLDALRLVLMAWQELGLVSPGDGVIVPGNTFIASVLAIVHARLKPVFVDPDVETYCLSGEAVERACQADKSIKVLMPVHLYGKVAWDADVAECVRKRNLLVIEDAAQSIGAISRSPGLFGSRRAGALGHAGAFSFYPTKNIGALGDAGAVVTHSFELARTVRQLANYGSDKRYHNIFAGVNSRLDPIQAAMLRAKLPDTAQANSRRFERAVAYNNVIDHPLVTKPRISPQVTDSVWHQYVIRVGNGRRNHLKDYLLSQGVETDIHYPIPPHLQPCFATMPHGELPVSELLANEVLSLPISDCTSVADAAAIGRIINSFPS
ncbi:MAG: DegT/DnrJ/EryC1/StrS family aminotransferase [Bacteroides sp.]|nr:DegT/DnrJ/EryC1/StrS family aminotransferase [Bacteroides sp.]